MYNHEREVSTMRQPILTGRFAAAVFCAGALAVMVQAQTAGAAKPTASAQSIPRTPDGKPDFQGVWQHPYVPDMSQNRENQKGAGPLPFTAAGADNFKNYDVSKFDYTGHCLPFGLLRSINVGGYPVQIMQNSQYISLLFEQNTWFNVIYMDRPHPAKLEPTWFGNSVGRW